MKILVFSDTHRKVDFMREALLLHRDKTDLIIHLGDNVSDAKLAEEICPATAKMFFYGNCDYFSTDRTVYSEAVFKLGVTDFVAFACHGHKYRVKDGNELIFHKARTEKAAIAFYGHTHKAEICEKNGIILMNPGSTSFPRGDEPCSYGIVNIENGKINPTIIFQKQTR